MFVFSFLLRTIQPRHSISKEAVLMKRKTTKDSEEQEDEVFHYSLQEDVLIFFTDKNYLAGRIIARRWKRFALSQDADAIYPISYKKRNGVVVPFYKIQFPQKTQMFDFWFSEDQLATKDHQVDIGLTKELAQQKFALLEQCKALSVEEEITFAQSLLISSDSVIHLPEGLERFVREDRQLTMEKKLRHYPRKPSIRIFLENFLWDILHFHVIVSPEFAKRVGPSSDPPRIDLRNNTDISPSYEKVHVGNNLTYKELVVFCRWLLKAMDRVLYWRGHAKIDEKSVLLLNLTHPKIAPTELFGCENFLMVLCEGFPTLLRLHQKNVASSWRARTQFFLDRILLYLERHSKDYLRRRDREIGEMGELSHTQPLDYSVQKLLLLYQRARLSSLEAGEGSEGEMGEEGEEKGEGEKIADSEEEEEEHGEELSISDEIKNYFDDFYPCPYWDESILGRVSARVVSYAHQLFPQASDIS